MMSENEEQEAVAEKPRLGIAEKLRRIIIALVLLLVLALIVAREIPHIFSADREKTVEKPQGKSIAKPADMANSVEKLPEKLPEKLEEPTREKDTIAEVVSVADTTTKFDERLVALEEQIKQLETAKARAEQRVDNIASSMLVLEQLKETVNAGKPYQDLLQKLGRLMEDTPDAADIIEKLALTSEKGVVAQNILTEEFRKLIKQALTANNSGWFQRLLHQFITIRKIGEQVGDDDESILARAEVRLVQGKLESVLLELENLSPPAKEVFSSWIKQVRDYLDIVDNIEKLQLFLTKTEAVLQP